MLVVDNLGEKLGVLGKEEALSAAREAGLDLVLVNPQGNPPVAKIVDWSKMKYDLKKKAKKKTTSSDLSEIRVKPFIDVGDLGHKINKMQELLDKGNKVKFTIQYKRGADHRIMYELMDKVKEKVSEFAKTEGDTKREGRNLAIYLVSK